MKTYILYVQIMNLGKQKDGLVASNFDAKNLELVPIKCTDKAKLFPSIDAAKQFIEYIKKLDYVGLKFSEIYELE